MIEKEKDDENVVIIYKNKGKYGGYELAFISRDRVKELLQKGIEYEQIKKWGE